MDGDKDKIKKTPIKDFDKTPITDFESMIIRERFRWIAKNDRIEQALRDEAKKKGEKAPTSKIFNNDKRASKQ